MRSERPHTRHPLASASMQALWATTPRRAMHLDVIDLDRMTARRQQHRASLVSVEAVQPCSASTRISGHVIVTTPGQPVHGPFGVARAGRYACGNRTTLVDQQLAIDGQLRAIVAVHAEGVVRVHCCRDCYVACTARQRERCSW